MCSRIKLTKLDPDFRINYGIERTDADLIKEAEIQRNGLAYGIVRGSLGPPSRPMRALTMRWGLETVNHPVHFTRIETAHMHPLFAECMQYRRCVVFVEGWWERDNYINTATHRHAPMLAIWRESPNGNRRFSILTRESPPSLIAVHPRTPLISDSSDWLRQGTFDLHYMAGYRVTKQAA